ncbi:c-type cytochrome [Pontibacter liquoris]|uniref:c-type cytochrome n=1 Tax=Pontibacter liquoris TaxID=2905677 RepID=UPI001FA78992|nr:c-type cytochrome [Pontibacter liquoris]
MKNSRNNIWKRLLLAAGLVAGFSAQVQAQESPMEEDFFKIMRVSSPEGTLLEVGGLVVLPNGDLGISTRRGDIFIVENPTSARPFFRKFASGLHEVLGLAYKNGSLYCAQRGELTKLSDTNNDGKADEFETIYAWPLSGNYHEYSFGPKIAADGSFFVTANLGFPGDWWHAQSMAPMRGWMMHITEDGKMEPWAAGFRSPAGLGMVDSELFYSENQGDWVGSGGVWHIKKGAFMGHPASLRWTSMSNSPLKLKPEDIYAKIDPRLDTGKNGEQVKPENREGDKYVTRLDAKKDFPDLQLPAVWLPHGVLGISNSEVIKIPEDHFGPFGGQLLVGDQGMSLISRVFLEKVNGEYQGAAFLFRSGFQSGVLRMAWANDGSLFVGETNRGWGSAGEANEGLQRLVWNNKVPFEMRAVRAMPDGFEVEFTMPVDKKSAQNLASYAVESFTYKYHAVYGSPVADKKTNAIKGVKLSDDGMRARLVVEGLRPGYVHLLKLEGVRARDNYYTLVHPNAYYTLNSIPAGQKLSANEVSTINSAAGKQAKATSAAKTTGKAKTTGTAAPSKKAAAAPKEALTFEAVKPLLAKHTCLSCHNTDKRQVGPAFREVAKRKYTDSQIVALIHEPKPENWPDHSTPMPPMPQVPQSDALKIASWINSLNSK